MGRNLVIKTFYQEMEGFHIKSPSYGCTLMQKSKIKFILQNYGRCTFAHKSNHPLTIWHGQSISLKYLNQNSLKRSKNAKKIVLNFGGKIQMFKDIESIKNHKMNYFGAKIQIHRFRKHFIEIEFLNKIWTFATVCSLNGTLTTVINLPLFKN